MGNYYAGTLDWRLKKDAPVELINFIRAHIESTISEEQAKVREQELRTLWNIPEPADPHEPDVFRKLAGLIGLVSSYHDGWDKCAFTQYSGDGSWSLSALNSSKDGPYEFDELLEVMLPYLHFEPYTVLGRFVYEDHMTETVFWFDPVNQKIVQEDGYRYKDDSKHPWYRESGDEYFVPPCTVLELRRLNGLPLPTQWAQRIEQFWLKSNPNIKEEQ